MKYVKFLCLLLGFALFSVLLHKTDIKEIWHQVTHIGWGGMTVVVGIYLVSFITDVYTWLLTFKTIPLNLQWLYRLFLVRIAGEAFNQVTPLASMGGESIKVIMLKSYYQIGYREAGASLVLAKTLDLMALMVFLVIGFCLLLTSDRLPTTFKTVAGLGLAAFSFTIAVFFLVQRFQLMSLISRWLGSSRFGSRFSGVLRGLRDTDEMVVGFYTSQRRRFPAALGVAFLNWPLGVLEIYYAMDFLGHLPSIADAWIIETVVQLISAGTFFIPATIGTQEGAFMVACSAIAGNPSLGLAVSLVRRFREIIWILAGLAIWWLFSFKPTLPNRRIS